MIRLIETSNVLTREIKKQNEMSLTKFGSCYLRRVPDIRNLIGAGTVWWRITSRKTFTCSSDMCELSCGAASEGREPQEGVSKLAQSLYQFIRCLCGCGVREPAQIDSETLEKFVMLEGKRGKQPTDLWKHEHSPGDDGSLDGHINASRNITEYLLNASN
jgi:hypothetical protein